MVRQQVLHCTFLVFTGFWKCFYRLWHRFAISEAVSGLHLDYSWCGYRNVSSQYL